MLSLIFDFDGVIIDTFEFHYQHIRQYTKLNISREEYRNASNGNIYQYKEWQNIDWFEYKKFIYNDFIQQKITPNIKTELEKLSQKSDLYIVTSGSENNISKLLAKNSLLPCFKKVLGWETDKSKITKFKLLFNKYHLINKNCLFITDTLGDILEANEVAIPTLAVDFGYHSKKCLAKGNPLKIISSFDEIRKFINT